MAMPRVKVPLEEYLDVIWGRFELNDLMNNLRSVIESDVPTNQVSAPTDRDWLAIGAPPRTPVARVHQLMRKRFDTWELVRRTGGPVPSQATKTWIQRNVISTCFPPAPPGGRRYYTEAVIVARQVAFDR